MKESIMGLDMYLTGDKFFKTFDKSGNEVERPIDLDGDSIQTISNDLGYWRKFGPLHTYIVDTFAGGVDECQRIELEEVDLLKIAEALMGNSIAKDEDSVGCFFGSPEMWAEEWLRANKESHSATFIAASEWLLVSNLTRNGVLFIIKRAGRARYVPIKTWGVGL
jgi:hypothetical protein